MRTRLLGRDDALAALEAALGRAAASQPTAVLIEGEAGIGKTALLQHLAAAAGDRGMRVLAGASLPGAGRDVPFLPWRGALRALNEESDLDSAGSPASRGQVLAAVTNQLLGVARRRGTLVALEDVHWADDSTLELLDYVIRSAGEERLLIAATVRSADPAFERVRERLTELGRLPQVTVLRPRRLTAPEVARHIEALTGKAPAGGEAEQVTDRSGGVPFFVEELVAAGGEEGTSGSGFADELLGHRILGLPESARALVDAAAVGRDPLDADLLFSACGLGDASFDGAFAEAMSAGVLETVGGGQVQFRHALLREAAAHRMPPRRARALHRRWAEAITGNHAASPGGAAAETAGHWSAAGETGRALDAYLRAADEAKRVFAHPERLRLLLAAVDAWDHTPDPEAFTDVDLGSVLSDAAELAHMLGDPETRGSLVERGRLLYAGSEDRARRAWFDLIEQWGLEEQNREVPLNDLVDLVAAIRERPPGRQVARALNSLSSRLMQDGDPESALSAAQEARELATVLTDPVLRVEAILYLALASAAAGRSEDAVRLSADGLAGAAAIGDLVLTAMATNARGVVLWESGDIPGSYAVTEQGRELLGGTRPGPLPTFWASVQLNGIEMLMELGRWDEATDRLGELDAAEEIQTPFLRGWASLLRTGLAVRRGEAGSDEVETGPEDDAETRQIQDVFGVAGARADALTDLSLFEESRIVTRGVLGQQRAERAIPAFVWPLLAVVSRNEVEAVTAEGVPDAGIVDRVAALSGIVPIQNALQEAYAAQVVADLSWVAGAVDEELCRAAAARWETLGLPYWHGWALLRTGQAAAGAGHVPQARAALAQALDIADGLRAAPLAERIHRAAVAASIRLVTRPGARRPDPVGLTGREHEVLALLAEGARNRGIAERLVISEKTVSVHVSNLLAKLHAGSRGEAVAVARRLGLLDGDPGSS